MHLDVFLALVLRLATGIMAIQAPGTPVKFADAVEWATAAAYHATRAGLDPFELIGLARNETDFRPQLVGPDGLDCGITQTRVIYSKYSCGRLRRDTWIAFEEAARELSHFQKVCQKRAPHDVHRCRLNSYNQGYRYRTTGRKGAYWLRVTCFAEAARAGVKPLGNCRRVRSRRDIARLVPTFDPRPRSVAANEVPLPHRP